MTPVAEHADRFIEHGDTYLLSHSVGLAVAGSRDVAHGYFDVWERNAAAAWTQWLDGIDGFRDALASLLATDRRSICPQSNVSSGLTKLLDSIRHEFDHPTVLISDDAFPSLGFVCERSDYAVRFAPRSADTADLDAWRTHLDGVDVAVITHVHSNTGECLPVSAMAEVARNAGVVTVVDVAQSAGIVPIDVDAWSVDAVVGSCVKWLSGGPGAGWLWVADAFIDRCHPTDVGWFSHEAPFEFDIHHYRDANDALRFWGGSPTVLPFLIAAHSIHTIDTIGVDTIRRHNRVLVDHLVAELGERVTSPHDHQHRGGTAIVRAEAATVELLAGNGIAVDHRTNGIRVSPHVHTSIDDLDRLVDILR